MTNIFALQYWIIFFLMVGLLVNRPHVTRYAWGAVTFAIGRFFFRSAVIWISGDSPTNVVGNIIGNEWLILPINTIVIGVLLSEMVTGTKCWRLYKIERRRNRRSRERVVE